MGRGEVKAERPCAPAFEDSLLRYRGYRAGPVSFIAAAAPMSVCVNERAIFTGVPVSCGARRGGLVQGRVLESETRQGERA